MGAQGLISTCRNCASGVDPNDRFCSYCRAAVGPQEPAAAPIRCTRCGEASPGGARTCEWCGAKLPKAPEPPTCPSCGQRNRVDGRFCLNCGGSLIVVPAADGARHDASRPAPQHEISGRAPERVHHAHQTPHLLELALAGRWTVATRIAMLASAIGIAFIALILAAIILIAIGMDGWDAVVDSDAGGSFARMAGLGVVFLWSAAHGATGFALITATGFAWAALSIMIATKIVVPSKRSDPYTALGIALKTGVVYGAIVTGAAYTLKSASGGTILDFLTDQNPFANGLGGLATGEPFSFLQPLGGLVGGLIVATTAVLVAFARNNGWSVVEAFGWRPPSRTVRGAWNGGVQTLVGSGITFLVLGAIGIGIALAQEEVSRASAGEVAAGIVILVLAFLFAGIDAALATTAGVAFLLFPGTVSDLIGQDVGTVPPTAYLAMLVPIVAGFRGGMVAARTARARTATEAARTGASAGAVAASIIAAWILLFATRLGAELTIQFLFGAALPCLGLFAVVGALGGFAFGDREGLPKGDLSERRAIPRVGAEVSLPARAVAAAPKPEVAAPAPARPAPTPVAAAPVAPVPAVRLPEPIVAAVERPVAEPTLVTVAAAATEATVALEPIATEATVVASPSELEDVIAEVAKVTSSEVWSELDALVGTPRPDPEQPPRVEPASDAGTGDDPCTAPCSASNPVGTRFCGYCGRDLMPTKECSECGASHPAELRFCRDCGADLT